MKNKIVLVCIFAAILLLAPMTSVTSQAAIEDSDSNFLKNKNNMKVPITEEEKQNLFENDYLGIIDRILTEDNEIDMEKFAEEIDIDEYFSNDLYQDVINLIIETIQDRLGWVYDGYLKTTSLINDAKALINDIQSLPNLIDKITEAYEKSKEVLTLLLLLIKGEISEFLSQWSPGLIVDDIMIIINNIQSVYNQITGTIQDVESFITSLEEFTSWINSNPWAADIHILGTVQNNNQMISDVTINCRDSTTTTDTNGNYDFYVTSNPDSNSIPANSEYGIHKCTITAEKEETIQESPSILSYSFSGGTIEYDFNDFEGGKIKNKEHIISIIEKIFREISNFFIFSYFF